MLQQLVAILRVMKVALLAWCSLVTLRQLNPGGLWEHQFTSGILELATSVDESWTVACMLAAALADGCS